MQEMVANQRGDAEEAQKLNTKVVSQAQELNIDVIGQIM